MMDSGSNCPEWRDPNKVSRHAPAPNERRSDQNADTEQPTEAENDAAGKRREVIFGVVVALGVLIAIVAAQSCTTNATPSDAPAAGPAPTVANPTQAPAAHSLRYFVNVASGTQTLITYLNDQGGTEQVDYTGPWDKVYTAFPNGASAYISVLNETGRGSSVECDIYLDGPVVRTSTGTSFVSCGVRAP